MTVEVSILIKFLTYFKIVKVCFINDLLENHVLNLIDENNKRSLSNREATRESIKNKRTFSSRSHTFDSIVDDERERSIPMMLGEQLQSLSDIKVSPNGPSFPSMMNLSDQMNKEDSIDERFKEEEENYLLIKHMEENFDVNKSGGKNAGNKINILALFNVILLLMIRYGNYESNTKNFNKGIFKHDRLNIVILPAILSALDYTICQNYTILAKFLKNIMLLEVYANLTCFNFNIPLKFAVWLFFLIVYISSLKYNEFAKKTLNNLQSHINFKIFQLNLDFKDLIIKISPFASLCVYMPLTTLIPLVIILQMISTMGQVVNMRFKKQDDPYHLFKIFLTTMTWLCSITVFGESKYVFLVDDKHSWLSSTKNFFRLNIIFFIKRICLVMACKYFALIVVDYKLTLVPLKITPDDITLHKMSVPLKLFEKNKIKNEKIIAKCNFIESVAVETNSNDIIGNKTEDFTTVVFFTNKRLVKWSIDSYREVDNETFTMVSWNFFKENFQSRALEITDLMNFRDLKDELGLNSHKFDIDTEYTELLVSNSKNQFMCLYNNDCGKSVSLIYFDIQSETRNIKQFELDNISREEIVAKYFFLEGSLGTDPAQSFLVVTKLAESIEINLTSGRIIKKKLNVVQNVDNWVKLKTNRVTDRCIIYDSLSKYIGQYVKFRGWKILPFPTELSQNITSYGMKGSKSMLGGMALGTSKFKMAPMTQQRSEPLSRMKPNELIDNHAETIIKITALEHLGYIYQITETINDKNKWLVRLIECTSGKIMKEIKIENKDVILSSIKMSHERELKFCGFCGFLSCKKLQLHYLVKQKSKLNKNTVDYNMVVIGLINNKARNIKRQRICFRVERDNRDVRCYGLNNTVEFKKVYKIKNTFNAPVYNPFANEYCVVRYSDQIGTNRKNDGYGKKEFLKVNLGTLGKMIHLPIDARNTDYQLVPFDNFKYSIPKPATDQEIRKSDLQELENDTKDVKKNIPTSVLKLKYLYNPSDDSIAYYY
ncbi:hypothetical protein QEN19_003158 [Hanseniaspora menglaensis]